MAHELYFIMTLVAGCGIYAAYMRKTRPQYSINPERHTTEQPPVSSDVLKKVTALAKAQEEKLRRVTGELNDIKAGLKLAPDEETIQQSRKRKT